MKPSTASWDVCMLTDYYGRISVATGYQTNSSGRGVALFPTAQGRSQTERPHDLLREADGTVIATQGRNRHASPTRDVDRCGITPPGFFRGPASSPRPQPPPQQAWDFSIRSNVCRNKQRERQEPPRHARWNDVQSTCHLSNQV